MKQHDEEAFRRLIGSVRPDVKPPPGCEERILRGLLTVIKARKSVRPSRPAWMPKRTWIFRGASATAAIAVVVLVCWWLVGGKVSTAAADFGEMLRHIRQAGTVAYDLVLRVPDQPEEKAEILMAGDGRIRVTWSDGSRMHIYSPAERRRLTVSPVTRTARLWSASQDVVFSKPLEDLRRTAESDGELIGKEMLDGREVAIFSVQQPHGEMRVWVNPCTNLPVRIEVKSVPVDGRQTVMVLGSLRWNVPIPDSKFLLEVPPGYTLHQPESEASEDALIESLRICAEMSDGTFPEKLTAGTVAKLLVYAEREDKVHTGGITAGPEPDDRVKKAYRMCLRGLAFIDRVSENDTWRYVGGGVKLGDGSSPICWWRPSDSTTFRVIYGDLKAKNVPPHRLGISKPVSPGRRKEKNLEE